jgi:hypothetical protein
MSDDLVLALWSRASAAGSSAHPCPRRLPERTAHNGYRVIARRPRSEIFNESVEPERGCYTNRLREQRLRLFSYISRARG